MTTPVSMNAAATCPSWCVRRHGEEATDDDRVHVSGALMVRRTVLRLCLTVDPESRDLDGPYVLVGNNEYTLHEADVLIAALTELVDEGRGVEVSAPVVPRMRQPGP